MDISPVAQGPCANGKRHCWKEPGVQASVNFLPSPRPLSSGRSAALAGFPGLSELSLWCLGPEAVKPRRRGMGEPGRMATPLPGVSSGRPRSQGPDRPEHWRAHWSPPIWPERWIRGITRLGLNWGVVLVVPYTSRTLPLALLDTHAEQTNLKEIPQLVFKILILLQKPYCSSNSLARCEMRPKGERNEGQVLRWLPRSIYGK